MQTLLLADDLFLKIEDGSKRSTIRLRKRDFDKGPLTLVSSSNPKKTVIVQITGVQYKFFYELTDEDGRLDGYADRQTLVEGLMRFYPDVSAEDDVTIIAFDV